MPETPFWEQHETVERFLGREPDHRLMALIPEFHEPARIRVLDLGCAGGRNTVYAAESGFDVTAVDGSEAMVAETRRRLLPILGADEADRRVRHGRMDRLEGIADDSIDLVVALGIYHGARSREEWDRTLAETFRVLRPGGRVLVSNHTDAFDPDGHGLERVPGPDPLFERSSGRSFLVDAETLDREMAAKGFVRLAETATVRRENDRGGVRVTANGFYGKPPA
jgi:SAM-dependent methyltransferase